MRLRIAALSALVCIASLPVQALTQRTFVSANGLDTNSCARTAPCRSFGAAVAATLDGGEVVALDSAGYGPVAINQSVSLISPSGVYAGITAFSGSAITINSSTATVVLRGLTLNSEGAANAIDVSSFTALYVEGCVVGQFSSYGLHLTAPGVVYLDDTLFRENHDAVAVFPASGSTVVSIDRCRFEQNPFGVDVEAAASTQVAVSRSVLSNSSSAAVVSAGAADVYIKNCVASMNGNAILVISGTVGISASLITDNTIGLDNSGGTLVSFNDNAMRGNATPTSGAITTVSLQ